MTPDYVLGAVARILEAVLPLCRRRSGGVADQDVHARTIKILDRLAADTRAAARSPTLAADLASVLNGYRLASDSAPAVIDGLERIVSVCRAWQPVAPASDTQLLQAFAEAELCGLIEALAVSGQALAVAGYRLRSHEEAQQLRRRLGLSFDVAIERAADAGRIAVLRQLRTMAAAVTRDLIERGRPLARMVTYQTAAPLPSVVLAWNLYQDAGRAGELEAENTAALVHPAWMPVSGRALSR